VLRAKTLREARKRGTPPVLTRVSSEPPSNGNSEAHGLDVEKAYLEQIVENAPEAISILDLELRIVRINDEFTRLFGFADDETSGRVIDTLIVPPDRSAETVWIAESVGRGKKLSLETRRQRKDGSWWTFWYRPHPSLSMGDGSRPMLHIATLPSRSGPKS